MPFLSRADCRLKFLCFILPCFAASAAWAQLPPAKAEQSGLNLKAAEMQIFEAGQADSPPPILPQIGPVPQLKDEAAASISGGQAGETAPAAKSAPPPQDLRPPQEQPPQPAPNAQDAQFPQTAPVPVPAPPQAQDKGGTAKIGLKDAQQMAQNIADKFSAIRTMVGEFIQFDPKGGQSLGTFYLERPGRIIFDYKDTPLRVICDGSAIAVNNRKLGSWNLYDLSKSPLNLLLADKISIANGRLLEFTQEPNAVTLVLGDETGRSKIRIIFDPKTYELKQWTMTDNGQDTTIQVLNTKTGVEFADNMFNINYYRYPKNYKK